MHIHVYVVLCVPCVYLRGMFVWDVKQFAAVGSFFTHVGPRELQLSY